MSLLAPLVPDSDARLAQFNPVAKLGLVFIVTCGLIISGDLVTPAIVLALELAVLPAAGIRLGTLARRGWPLLVGVAGVAVANLLIVDTGDPRLLIDAGPVHVTVGAVAAAAAVSVRLLAITLPGIVVLAATDPLDLADSLVQQLRAPPRFAYGALAGLRLLPLLSLDWQQLRRARRARGIDAGRSPVALIALSASLTFALLVAAIRRGVRLAAAMEARGFGAHTRRSVARPQQFAARDYALLGLAFVAVGGATAVSLALGTWVPAFG